MFGALDLVSRNTPAAGTAFYAFDERGNRPRSQQTFSTQNTHEGNIWSGGVVIPHVISLSLSLRVRKSS